MSEEKNIRINKVLNELNISLDRAIEFLHSNGFETENSRNTKVSQKEFDALVNEFDKDRGKKMASQEVSEEIRKEKEAIRIEREKELEEKRKKVEEELKKQEIIRARATLAGPKAVGKIDLEPKKPEATIQAETPENKVEKPVEEISNEVEKPLETPTDVKATEANIENDDEKAPEVIDGVTIDRLETKYQKLSGTTLTGQKIDLSQFNKPKKKAEEPKKVDAKSDANNDLAKKRKRIPTKPNTAAQNQAKKKFTNTKPVVNKVEPTEEDVKNQIRETLEKLQGKGNKSKASKYRKEKRDVHKQRTDDELLAQEEGSKILKVTEFVTVGEISTMMDVNITKVIGTCMSLGIMVTMNQRLDAETLTIVADEFGFGVEFIKSENEENIPQSVDSEDDLKKRAPIVTVMGHVDHGKTSLLDYIRQTNVIAGESGGITQHIGAYGVQLENGEKIAFLDTPGHEAFTAMRARGTQVTDIAIIVVAADDDIMPQTKEAISHAQAAGVPMIFAINKVDKPTANPEKIKEKLAGMNLLVEDWGGKIQSHDISAKTGLGVAQLLEKVLLEAEMLELTANPDKPASGTIIEAFLDKGKGYVSTILVQAGTLKIGDYVLAGKHHGKVKAMQDERGKDIKFAGPSTPVSILGLDGAPTAGDKFNVFEDEREAKQIANKRLQLMREQSVRVKKHITLDEIGRRIALGDFQELNIILKGDVDGSVEALSDSFSKLSTEKIQIKIIHKGVGAITESDVLLASASDAIIIGFNVRPQGNAKQLAEKEEIDIKTYSIIYAAIDDVRDAMEGMLSPEIKEEITGTAEIRETFKITKVGTIAGCMVIDGKIFRNNKVRLIRDGVVIYTGELATLKRFKDDVKEVAKGYDCGIQIKNYNDIEINDHIECYKEVEVKSKL